MNNKERFLAAVRGDVPDKVPVAPLIHDRFACKLLGRTGWKAVFDVHRMIGSIWFRGPLSVGFDVDWPSGYGTRYGLIKEEESRRIYEHLIETPIGRLSSKVMYGMVPSDPALQRTIEYFIKDERDFEIYRAYLEELLKRVRPSIHEVVEAYNTIGDDGLASVGSAAPFDTLAYSARGPERLLVDLLRRPDLVQEVISVLQQVNEREIEAFMGSPSELLWYDISAAYDLSPVNFSKWLLPDLRRVVERVKGGGKYVGFYMSGKIKELLPIALEANPHFIEPFELQSNITLRDAKRLYGSKICVMGNFDPVVLAFGSTEEAKREALRCLEEGMEGGGYVMTTADEVPADAKLGNLKIMVEMADRHGVY